MRRCGLTPILTLAIALITALYIWGYLLIWRLDRSRMRPELGQRRRYKRVPPGDPCCTQEHAWHTPSKSVEPRLGARCCCGSMVWQGDAEPTEFVMSGMCPRCSKAIDDHPNEFCRLVWA